MNYNKGRKSYIKTRLNKYKRVGLLSAILILIVGLGINKFIGKNSKLLNSKSAETDIAPRSISYEEDKFTICIDAGHGDWDVGAIGVSGTYEKDIVLEVALMSGQLLEESGINVVYTRTIDNLSWSDNSVENLY